MLPGIPETYVPTYSVLTYIPRSNRSILTTSGLESEGLSKGISKVTSRNSKARRRVQERGDRAARGRDA